MRGLKIAAIAAVSLLLVMALLVCYLFLTAHVTIVRVDTSVSSAQTDTAAFEALKTSVEEDAFQGTLYQKPTEWKQAGDYEYRDYTVRMRNDCLVPIDMIEVQVVPQSTDILQLGDRSVHSLDAKTEGDIAARVLVPKDAPAIREIIVTYYVWGVSFHLKATGGV